MLRLYSAEQDHWRFETAERVARVGRLVALAALAVLCASEFLGLVPFRHAWLARVVCLAATAGGFACVLFRRYLVLDFASGTALWGWRIGSLRVGSRTDLAQLQALEVHDIASGADSVATRLERDGSEIARVEVPRRLASRLQDALLHHASPPDTSRPATKQPTSPSLFRLAYLTVAWLGAVFVVLAMLWPLLSGIRGSGAPRREPPRFHPNLFKVHQALMQAMDAMRRQDYAEAQRLYMQIIAIEPHLEDARVLLARAHLEAGEREQALAAARSGLRVVHGQRWALLELIGEIHERSNDLEQAHIYYLEALAHQRGPERSRTLTKLARLELAKGERDRARERLRAALNTGANDEWTERARQMLASLPMQAHATGQR